MGSSGHEEGAPGVFWAWVEGATSNMALAFEGLVEQVRSWTIVGGLGGLGLSSIMDTLNTLLIGWIVFVVLIVLLSSFFYVKFIQKLESDALAKTKNEGEGERARGTAASLESSSKRAAVSVARTPTIVPTGPPDHASPPVATGADPDAVNWATNIFTWLFNSADGAPNVRKIFLDTVNNNTVKTALETGILVEVVEIYAATPAPSFFNMVVDCSPTDNITITCDCDITVYLRVVTTRTQKDVTTESEYACAVNRLRGRLNVGIITEDLSAVVKFDGWPEVVLDVEGIRNNAEGLEEQQVVEVIDEVITSALRNSVYDVNFQPIKTFPRFRRARQAPDRIIPVGYDSMVRELQTHPPPPAAKAPKPQPALISVIHDEELEVAGESFSAINFPSSLSQQIALTTSEEQLIQRNLNKYPSLENEITECYQQSWEENYVPAAQIPEEEEPLEEEPPAEVPIEVVAPPLTVEEVEEEEEPPSTNFVLVVSNRQKLIDEPRSAISIEEVEEEVEEPAPPIPARKIDEEPCLRRGAGGILAQPKEEEPVQIEDEEEELDEPLQLEEMNFMDKSMSATSGFGPLPSLPGLTKGPFALQSSTTGQSLGIPGLNGKRLLVKIVKATGIGCEKDVTEGYAVVEMDEPSQKFTTSVIKDTNSPFWDEQFLFDLSDGTLELLFELYDKKDGSFLGLGIVGIEELVATPSQRQIIPLQSRPYENDEVSGSLTVEFLFLDRADLPDLTLRSSATSQSLSSKGDLVTTTTTTYVKAPESQDVIVNGGDGVAAAALRDIEEKKAVVANNASKSTMIIHASRKPEEEDGYEGQPAQDLTALTTTATTTTAVRTHTATSKPVSGTTQSPTITMTTTPNTTTAVTNDGVETTEIDERGRSRGNRRKRDSFFGTLKKRFSRSKVRSKSMEPGNRDLSMDRDMSVGRSISVERHANRASEEQQEHPSPLRDTLSPRLLAVPASAGGDGGSTRSSLSDASAISSSSTRTYVNEASTLIVETKENGVLKHYLIPLSLQQKSKWRKKGLKLHVYNEHTFVAKHMSSTTPCQVCQKTLGRRFGKQGYECRDCGFKCHKPCHVKTDTMCPNTTVNTMDLEHVKDPREERKALIKKMKAA